MAQLAWLLASKSVDGACTSTAFACCSLHLFAADADAAVNAAAVILVARLARRLGQPGATALLRITGCHAIQLQQLLPVAVVAERNPA